MNLRFEARHGQVEHFAIDGAPFPATEVDMSTLSAASIYDVPDWTARLAKVGMDRSEALKVGPWMNRVLGTEFTTPQQ